MAQKLAYERLCDECLVRSDSVNVLQKAFAAGASVSI